MIKTPGYQFKLQSDLDFAGFNPVNLTGWPPTGGGGGTGLLPGWVSVKDAPYNAMGNGVADDTVAIQSAINAVFALGGGTVFFPRGTYLCNGAFDATNNSILQIPVKPGTGVVAVPMVFMGEAPPASLGLTNPACPTIKSTKTGTGTGPALLASGPYFGGAAVNNVNQSFTMVFIKNLSFLLPDNPTISAIRLEISAYATLEDLEVYVASGGSVEPTNDVTAIWMPNTGNGGRNFANRIRVMGFGTAFKTGEHFRAPDIFPYLCKVGIDFMVANDISWANVTTFDCPTHVKFSGYHPVQLFLDLEQYVSGSGVWNDPVGKIAIVDPSNFGRGEIQYHITEASLGPVPGPITMTGGNYLTLTNLYNMTRRLAPSGTFMIGTDARLVPITGGMKIQARNPGTNTWVDADSWTNP